MMQNGQQRRSIALGLSVAFVGLVGCKGHSGTPTARSAQPAAVQGIHIVLVLRGWTDASEIEALTDAVRANHGVVIERVNSQPAPLTDHGPSGVAGGVDGAPRFATSATNLVIGLAPSHAGESGSLHLRYDIVDVKARVLLANGNEPASDGVVAALKRVLARFDFSEPANEKSK